MSELSNALRHRLAAREEPQVHPDPDSLTAYLEQLLPAPERNQVLEHLAVCRQCREVVALSQPQQPVIEDVVAVALPVRRGWWSWIVGKPALGLAGSLAGLAVVAALIIELPRGSFQKQAGQPAPLTSANNNLPAATPAPPEPGAQQPEGAPAAGAASTVRDKEFHEGSMLAKAQNRPAAVPAEPRATRTVPKVADSSVGGPYVNTQMFANDTSNAVTAQNELPSAPQPRTASDFQNSFQANLSLSNNAQLTTADVPHQAQGSKALRMLNPAVSAGHAGLSTVITLGRDAKQIFHRPAPAINAYRYGFASSAMGGAGQFNPAKEMGAAPEVTTAAPLAAKDAGELEQSHALTARARSATSAGTLDIDGLAVNDRSMKKTETAQPAWKVGDSKLLKLDDSGAWTEAAASEGIEFSVVSSHGSDIWAGGANAAVVHSRDGGATWERITLGSSATGTITSIEAGAVKVLVKSSSGQSWSSPDGGKTWVLQD
jgi:Photosynthesis system II assembly factor YCF48/Putative zinc-finger